MNARFEKFETLLPGLIVVRRKTIGDQRGFLTRLFDAEDMAGLGWPGSVFQVNETGTTNKGTVRGLHFQYPPFAEAKLVACVGGSIFDVAVDIRRNSPTFLQIFTVELSAENGLSLMLPEGFAHGFQAMTDDVRMIYTHSAPYRSDAEGGLNPADPALPIAWPLPIVNLSQRDMNHPLIDETFRGVDL